MKEPTKEQFKEMMQKICKHPYTTGRYYNNKHKLSCDDCGLVLEEKIHIPYEK